ncbi:hypothetical protein [Bacillus alkalicellulosilyticus]|uniref:hypothetical protein n=1 Tax=Alkalihalobacterium alkalicellulosilyticum TaxID=1912214 RepID=UPI001482D0AE|nr:hypothetical protein [Bacillus alkalicellulosilyticus]
MNTWKFRLAFIAAIYCFVGVLYKLIHGGALDISLTALFVASTSYVIYKSIYIKSETR